MALNNAWIQDMIRDFSQHSGRPVSEVSPRRGGRDFRPGRQRMRPIFRDRGAQYASPSFQQTHRVSNPGVGMSGRGSLLQWQYLNETAFRNTGVSQRSMRGMNVRQFTQQNPAELNRFSQVAIDRPRDGPYSIWKQDLCAFIDQLWEQDGSLKNLLDFISESQYLKSDYPQLLDSQKVVVMVRVLHLVSDRIRKQNAELYYNELDGLGLFEEIIKECSDVDFIAFLNTREKVKLVNDLKMLDQSCGVINPEIHELLASMSAKLLTVILRDEAVTNMIEEARSPARVMSLTMAIVYFFKEKVPPAQSSPAFQAEIIDTNVLLASLLQSVYDQLLYIPSAGRVDGDCSILQHSYCAIRRDIEDCPLVSNNIRKYISTCLKYHDCFKDYNIPDGIAEKYQRENEVK